MTGKAEIRDPRKSKAKRISNNSNINFNQGRGTSYRNALSAQSSQPFLYTEGDLNLNTYDIINVDRMLFATAAGSGDTITATDYGIEAIANGATAPYGITYQIPASKIHSFKVGTNVPLTIADNYVIISEDLTTTNIEVGTNTIKFTETTTPSSPGTNKGVIYAKDVSGVTTPMWYDGTTETSLLGGGSSGAGLADNNVWTGTNQFTGSYVTVTGSFSATGASITLGNSSSDLINFGGTAGSDLAMSGNDLEFGVGGTINFYSSASTASGGSASALPSNPTGYFAVKHQGNTRYIPFYS